MPKMFMQNHTKFNMSRFPLNFEDMKKRKNIANNLRSRSRETKVCTKQVFVDKNMKNNIHFVQVHFTNEMYCYIQLLQGGSAHARLNSHYKAWSNKKKKQKD